MSIRINVNPQNPGQFFACCGLLELADRLWPNSILQGAFSTTQFQLFFDAGEHSLKELMDQFIKADVSELDSTDKVTSPLHLAKPFDLRLDWWSKVETPDKTRVNLGGGDQLKTWAGRQLGPTIFRLMKKACNGINLQTPLDESRAIYDAKDGKAKKKTISPFYFDARLAGTSLDKGFSPDEQEMSVMAYPAVESLALVGLQRFRPLVDENSSIRGFLYTVWADPLPPVIAMVAAAGMMPVRSCGTFRFTKPSRGGEYATMFSLAKSENKKHI